MMATAVHQTTTNAPAPHPRPVLPDPLIIGLVGPAGSGKDTVAQHLVDAHRFERHAFAAPLRDMLDTLLTSAGLDYTYLYEPRLKEQPIPGLGVSYRHLAQTLGTEWGRQCIAPDLWVRVAELALGLPDAPVHDRIVITDVRFANEAIMIRGHRGLLVRVDRDTAPVRAHVSERESADIQCHRVVYNTSSLSYLHDQLDALVDQIETGRLCA